MKWDHWLDLYLSKYCTAQGLSPKTIALYQHYLIRFCEWAKTVHGSNVDPATLKSKDILDYVTHLKEVRENGASSVNGQVVIIRNLYRAMVALEQIEYRQNPTLTLPKMKPPKRKFKDVLTQEEVERLLARPRTDTILGLRDRAILALLYGTGIRASECANLIEGDVDFGSATISVIGKGGHQRTVPLNSNVLNALKHYWMARGRQKVDELFFRSRKRSGATRGIVYSRVRRLAQLARVAKRVTPHLLRHTFATHLIRLGEKLPVIRDLLGHRCLSSTQVYLHMTGEDLREAVERHPVGKLLSNLGDLLPTARLRFQYPLGTRFAINN